LRTVIMCAGRLTKACEPDVWTPEELVGGRARPLWQGRSCTICRQNERAIALIIPQLESCTLSLSRRHEILAEQSRSG
jgi:hypothetical protein